MAHPKTYVFLDLEGTGLLNDNDKTERPNITEIALLAVKSSDINYHAHISNIRIKQKILLCVQPKVAIHPEASQISGLSNSNLADIREFDRNTAEQVNLFLSRLEKPICLVAHNGTKYDFPLLAIEMIDAGLPLADDLVYLDTLSLLRKTCSKQKNGVQYQLCRKVVGRKRSADNEQTQTPVKVSKVSKNLFPDVARPTQNDDGFDDSEVAMLLAQACSKIELGLKAGEEISTEDEETVSREQYFGVSKRERSINGSSSRRGNCVANEENSIPDVWPVEADDEATSRRSGVDAEQETTAAATNFAFTSLQLPAIYRGIFGRDFPDAHNAECDTQALLEVCHAIWNHLDTGILQECRTTFDRSNFCQKWQHFMQLSLNNAKRIA